MSERRVRLDVIGCARCGEDHQGVEFRWFHQPPVMTFEGSEVQLEVWGSCPTTGDPIIGLFEEVEDDR